MTDTTLAAKSNVRDSAPAPRRSSVDVDLRAGEVRPLAKTDIRSVAAIYNRVFLKSGRAAPDGLAPLLEQQFLPDGEAAGSLVYERGGVIAGFVGSIATQMRVEGREVRAAVLTSLMMDDHASDPMGGAKLIRAMVSGPQDITISETASATSVAMWRSLRGAVLPAYSLDWLKILKPAGFITARLAKRSVIARLARPIAGAVDRALAARPVGPMRWRPFTSIEVKGVTSRDVQTVEAAAIIRDLSSHFAASPIWSGDALERRLDVATSKSLLGPMTCRAVFARGAKPIGIFIYHGQRRNIGHALQVLALPGHAGSVVDELFRHAESEGLTAVRGRADPALLEAMLGRDCSFSNIATTVAIARDQSLLQPMINGHAFITGLAAETWSSLVGNDFSR